MPLSEKKNVVHIGVVNWVVGPISIGSLKSGLHLAKTNQLEQIYLIKNKRN